jgi:hypothetical protein
MTHIKTRIKLIVTGVLEHEALKQSLEPLFPEVYFGVSKVQDGFTSNALKVPYLPPNKTTTSGKGRLTVIERLFNEALASAEPREPEGHPFDYAIIIDDTELANLRQMPVVIDYAKQALAHYLQNLAKLPNQPSVHPKGKLRDTQPPPTTPQGRQDFFRTRCSLHFLAPMAEAVFFGDSNALQRAQIKTPSAFSPRTQDVEDFEVNHPNYPGWIVPTVKTWYQPWMQFKHPKDYLNFLCGGAYREVEQGKAALEALDWQQVLAQPTFTQFARALIDDIARMANHPLPWLADTTHELTRCKTTQPSRVLRNL